MTMRATKLFAVAALCTGTAHADITQLALAPQPQPKAPPMTLATGAPACGNVMAKYASAEDPLCRVIRINEALEAKGKQHQRELEERRRSLTRDLLRRLGL